MCLMGDSIHFEATVLNVADRSIVRVPAEASAKLPSRGQVAVTGTIDGKPFATVIEPDGMRGHWLAVHQKPGKSVAIDLQPTKAWPEPVLPHDFQKALTDAPHLSDTWASLTPMARWEWVRWVGATRNPDTRSKRIDVTISKLEKGSRRPCCFDLSSCTDPELSKNGKLLGLT